jgi:hypothetical protein
MPGAWTSVACTRTEQSWCTATCKPLLNQQLPQSLRRNSSLRDRTILRLISSQMYQVLLIHAQRKSSIGWQLTLRLNRSSTECGTQPDEGSDIPGSLLDIVVERICIASLSPRREAAPFIASPPPRMTTPTRSRHSPITVRSFMLYRCTDASGSLQDALMA